MDHEPPHVHALGPGVEAKFQIRPVLVIFNHGFSNRDLQLIQKFLERAQHQLMEEWYDWQNK